MWRIMVGLSGWRGRAGLECKSYFDSNCIMKTLF